MLFHGNRMTDLKRKVEITWHSSFYKWRTWCPRAPEVNFWMFPEPKSSTFQSFTFYTPSFILLLSPDFAYRNSIYSLRPKINVTSFIMTNQRRHPSVPTRSLKSDVCLWPLASLLDFKYFKANDAIWFSVYPVECHPRRKLFMCSCQTGDWTKESDTETWNLGY